MPWLQLSLEAGAQDPEHLSDLFTDLGALSVTLVDAADEPVLEPGPGETPLWSHTRVVALFDAGIDPESVRAGLARHIGDAARHMTAEPLEDRDWTRAWMDDFAPMRFGERLWVIPGDMTPPAPDAVNLRLDPGLAFGTGTHPTTALCLAWLDAHPPAGQDVIDYGCGSGILAIAALKLGARRVRGVDIDPQALIASRDNARRNGVEAGLALYLPADLPAEPADLLLANILANPLIELAPTLVSLVRPGGRLVLSGILAGQADAVAAAYAPHGELEPVAEQEGWVRLVVQRPPLRD